MIISRNILTFTRNLLILLAVLAVCILVMLQATGRWGVSDSFDIGKRKSWVGAYLSGYHASQMKDYDAASEFFSSSLKLDKSSEMVQTQTMNLLVVTGRYDKAFQIADHLYRNNQNLLAAIVKIIESSSKGNFKEADIIANQLAKNKDSSTVINQVIYAWVKFGNGNYIAAKTILDSLQKETRYLPFVNYHYALISGLQGDSKKQAEMYTYLGSLENPPLGIAATTYNYYLGKNNKIAAARIVNAYGKDREIQLKKYHKIEDAKQGIAESLLDTGSIIMAEYKDDSAATFFALSLYLRPDFDEVKLLLANILINQGDTKAANKLLKSINEKSHLYDFAELAIAKNYEAMEQVSKAKQYYERLSADKNTRLEALVNLGDLKREAGRFDEAAEYYTKAIDFVNFEAGNGRLDPNYWALYFARGVCYERDQKWQLAEADLKKALELNPNQPDVLNYLGYTWIDNEKNLEAAVKLVTLAYELKPSDSHILDSVGWGWYKLGNYDNALRFLEAAITQMPYDATVNDHLGDVYWRLGRKNEAKYQWQRALDNKPEEKQLETLQQKVKDGLPELAIKEAPLPIDQSATTAPAAAN